MKLDKLQEAYDEMFDFITDLPSGLDGFESDFDAAYKELLEAKSADVAPVVHAKWAEVMFRDRFNARYWEYLCSSCNRYANREYDYCPNCGAKMDLEEDK